MPNNRVTAYLQDPIHCVSNHQEKHAILRKQETKYNNNSFVNFSQDLTTKRGNHRLPKPTATNALKKIGIFLPRKPFMSSREKCYLHQKVCVCVKVSSFRQN